MSKRVSLRQQVLVTQALLSVNLITNIASQTNLLAIQDEAREAVAAISCVIGSAVEQQETVTRRIFANVDQAAVGTRDVSASMVEVNRAAEETDRSAEAVLRAVAELAAESTTLKNDVETFLGNLQNG